MGSVPTDRSLTEKIRAESRTYRDIIQETFIDSYENLTYKSVMWMRWVSVHCRNAYSILKTDDDIFVNRFVVLKMIREFYDRSASKSFVICRVWENMPVERNNLSKWYVSPDEYSDKTYRPYCSGGAYILSGDLPKSLYRKSLETKFFRIDDYYVTGMLIGKVNEERNVTFHNIGPKMVIFEKDVQDVGNLNEMALFEHFGENILSAQYERWKSITENRAVKKKKNPKLVTSKNLKNKTT